MRHHVLCLLIVFLAVPSFAQESVPDQPVTQIFDIRDLVDGEGEVADLVREVKGIGAEGIEQLVPREGHVLVVVATKDAMKKVANHLTELRRLRSQVITLEVRFLKLPNAKGLGLPAGRSAGPIDSNRVTALLTALSKPGGGELASAPRPTCYPGQEAEIVMGRQISYVRVFEIKQTNGGIVADPIIDTARDGFFMKATPAISETPDAIDIDLDLTLSEVAQPLLTRSKLLNRGQQVPVEIQIPQVTELRIVRSGTVSDGRTYGFDAGPVPFAGFGGNHLVILVTAKLTSLESLAGEK